MYQNSDGTYSDTAPRTDGMTNEVGVARPPSGTSGRGTVHNHPAGSRHSATDATAAMNNGQPSVVVPNGRPPSVYYPSSDPYTSGRSRYRLLGKTL